MAKVEKIKVQEDRIFIPTPTKVRLNDGSMFNIPPITWGREIRILRVLKNILEGVFGSSVSAREIPQIYEGMPNEEKLAAQAIIEDLNVKVNKNLMQVILDQGPDQITEAASALVDQDKEWVEENMTIETILEILVPFLRNKQESVQGVLRPFLNRQ